MTYTHTYLHNYAQTKTHPSQTHNMTFIFVVVGIAVYNTSHTTTQTKIPPPPTHPPPLSSKRSNNAEVYLSVEEIARPKRIVFPPTLGGLGIPYKTHYVYINNTNTHTHTIHICICPQVHSTHIMYTHTRMYIALSTIYMAPTIKKKVFFGGGVG